MVLITQKTCSWYYLLNSAVKIQFNHLTVLVYDKYTILNKDPVYIASKRIRIRLMEFQLN